MYSLGSQKLDKSMDVSIQMIEDEGLEESLRQEVILLWNKIEMQFDSNRKPKR